ncbi:hypothetical protein, partial [uncultured Chryseobacterium sp.]|uniref:hypothetical protein n=1 Tax=uncultured Chryseobacterium sp. TaxID=259322 RepID=UPI0025CEBC55
MVYKIALVEVGSVVKPFAAGNPYGLILPVAGGPGQLPACVVGSFGQLRNTYLSFGIYRNPLYDILFFSRRQIIGKEQFPVAP